jgi:hypothetical protein
MPTKKDLMPIGYSPIDIVKIINKHDWIVKDECPLFSGLINHVNHDRRGATCREIVPEIGGNGEKRMKWRRAA